MKTDTSKYVTTDLVCESGTICAERYKSAKYERRYEGGAVVEVLTVRDSEGEAETGRRIGRYVTISKDGLKSPHAPSDDVCDAIKNELSRMIADVIGEGALADSTVLVAGLGNRFIAPDALGAKCADKVTATRHLKSVFEGFGSLGCPRIATLDPGVLSQTGIESFDIIKGAAERIDPDVVIVIDAMAARSTSRLATTVQISDSGLSPGGGVGNKRPAIDRESIGRPVISIGSPTVVSSSTLIVDALGAAGEEDISPELEEILDNGKDFFVSLNDSDLVIEHLSDVISKAINIALGVDGL